jgi:hypothetical protein
MNKSGGRQPAVVGQRSGQKNEFVVRGERQNQERRASARRGSRNRVCNGDRVSRGGTFRPWTRLARATIENRNRSAAVVGQQERRALARRGLRAAPATATVYRGVIAFLAHDRHQASDGEQGKHSGGVITFLAHVRYSNHGWLTPAAPVRMCGGVCTVTLVFRRFGCLPRGADAPRSCVGVRTSADGKTIFAMHERILPGAAGVSPPWLASRVCNGDRVSLGMIAFLAHDRHQASDGEQGKRSGG